MFHEVERAAWPQHPVRLGERQARFRYAHSVQVLSTKSAQAPGTGSAWASVQMNSSGPASAGSAWRRGADRGWVHGQDPRHPGRVVRDIQS